MNIFPTIDSNTVEYFRFVNSFAPWFSAAGTITAVCVSLWLGLRDNFIRLKLDVDRASPMLATVDTVRLSVTNIGTRKVNIVRAYVEKGTILDIKNEPPIHQLRTDRTLPRQIEDGAILQIDFPIDALAQQLKDDLKLTPWWNSGMWVGWYLRTIKVGVVTSTGKSFEIRLHPAKIDGFMSNFRAASKLI